MGWTTYRTFNKKKLFYFEENINFFNFFIVGNLKGFDQNINLILNDSHERVFSTTSGVEKVPLGLYVIRGDTVAMVSLVKI